MAHVDVIRNGIINKLLTISNKDYLNALHQLVESSSIDNDKVKLSKEQVLMLKLSDKDIKHGRLISQSQLDKDDLKWLKNYSLDGNCSSTKKRNLKILDQKKWFN